jgi:hypothetical protein
MNQHRRSGAVQCADDFGADAFRAPGYQDDPVVERSGESIGGHVRERYPNVVHRCTCAR